MPQVRCPQCGAINETRAPDYPFCVGCQDNLAKCGYCRWFDDGVGVCIHAGVRDSFEVRAGASPPCGYHFPRASLLVRRERRLALVVAIGLAAAVFTLGWGLLKVLQPPRAASAAPGSLQLQVEVDYRGAVVGRAYRVLAEIYNTTEVVVSGVRFEISKDFLAGFELRQVTPRPTSMSQSGQWQVLAYPEMHARERRTIQLELVPTSPGTFQFMAQLFSGAGVYHGRAALPITVRCGGPAGSRMGGGRDEAG